MNRFYFKDANKWEKDTQNKKMNESIKTITRKQMIQIKEWEGFIFLNLSDNPISFNQAFKPIERRFQH